jgi:thiosulfate/3-mercaptopyruvate sulfurtransferase
VGQQHQLRADTPVALYGSDTDNAKVAARLQAAGFTHLSTLSDALSQPERLQKLPHFEQLVYPQWLHDLQQGKAVTAAPAGQWKVIEAAWGAPKFYLLNHIPGAGYIDTNEVESEPLWNKVSDAQLKALLAKQGIRHDTTVILYGRDVYAAARVAQILLYAGVKDVRLLDGGWKSWSDAGLPVERGMPPEQKPAPDFGAPIPGQPQLMLNMEQARALLHRQDASLVSIRSWPEFIGTTSGYSYIKPKARLPAPAGARRERLHPYGRLPQPGRHHAQRGGYHRHVATVEYSSRSAGLVLLRHRLARLRDLYVRPRHGLEKYLGVRWRLVRMEQRPEKPGADRRARPG